MTAVLPPLLAAMAGGKPRARRERIRGELTEEQMLSLHYDPLTGRIARTIVVDECIRRDGYRLVSVDGQQYSAHRLAWRLMRGQWPSMQVDHANMDRADNRWGNLREATKAENQANVPRRRTNKSGLKGVSWHKQIRKWVGYLQVSGKNRNLGTFNCPAAAHFAYVVAAEKAFGEFARGS